MAYLAIDQGGHASRAMVFDAQGQQLAQAEVTLDTYTPHADWVEHDPMQMVTSIQQALIQIGQQIDVKNIVAAGLATQRSSIACWDRISGAALSPIISWQDRRQHRWIQPFSAANTHIHQQTGLFVSPHYGASKLRWCLDHLPALHQQQERICMGPLASFLLNQLLQEHPCLADPANASRTLLWNIHHANWDAELCQLFGIPMHTLPRCVPSQYPFGHLTLNHHPIPLILTTGDQSAALFAWGQPNAQQTYINIGTGAFIQRPCDITAQPSRLLCSVAFIAQDMRCYTLEGTVNGAARALQWFADLHGVNDWSNHLNNWLTHITQPPLFLNGISGLGSPDWVAQFDSAFVPDNPTTDLPTQFVAIAESIIFLIQRNLEAMGKSQELYISGGLANLDPLCQKLANLQQQTIIRPQQTEATTRGLAWLLAGRPTHWPQGTSQQFTPQTDPALQMRYQHWREQMNKRLAA